MKSKNHINHSKEWQMIWMELGVQVFLAKVFSFLI